MIAIEMRVTVPDGAKLRTVAEVFEAVDVFVTELQGLAGVDASWASAGEQVRVLPALPVNGNGNGHVEEVDLEREEEPAALLFKRRGSGKGARYNIEDLDALRVAVRAEMRRLAEEVDGVMVGPSQTDWNMRRDPTLPGSNTVVARLGNWNQLVGEAGLVPRARQHINYGRRLSTGVSTPPRAVESEADSSGAVDAPEEEFPGVRVA